MCKYQVDRDRVRRRLERLAEIGRAESGGWTRLSWTEEDRQAREVVTSFMREAGMTVRTDAAGNLIGRLEGQGVGETPVAVGSHIDTVVNGGMFDGAMGVILGLEVAQVLHDENVEMKRPLEVIIFADEEGARFGAGLIGSRAMAGSLNPSELYAYRDSDGVSIAEAMREFGLDPDRVSEARVEPGSYRAYLEAHVEQGKVLEDADLPVGLVTAISAPVWLQCEVKGKADHAGATPMGLRRDALLASSAAALEVERAAREMDEVAVATVGRMEISPGGINIIPGQARFTVDIRHVDEGRREVLLDRIREAIKVQAGAYQCEALIEEIMRVSPVSLSPQLEDLLAEELRLRGVPYMRLVSGASHDAQLMASLTEVGMLFVKSREGLSHSPEEHSDWNDIASAGEGLLGAVQRLLQE